ncbi:Uncharacterized protein dnm_003970 [Desulfonema magnum]|uniref:Uncharacterized protein n=1 Tax=Desulfonema magnum TaxID=45655 RepID=A0A975GK72_9BACT|nr:Uncharacterized protein dnm_003970 [Desulfonema magnum]
MKLQIGYRFEKITKIRADIFENRCAWKKIRAKQSVLQQPTADNYTRIVPISVL